MPAGRHSPAEAISRHSGPGCEARHQAGVAQHFDAITVELREGEAQRHVPLAVERAMFPARLQFDHGPCRGADRDTPEVCGPVVRLLCARGTTSGALRRRSAGRTQAPGAALGVALAAVRILARGGTALAIERGARAAAGQAVEGRFPASCAAPSCSSFGVLPPFRGLAAVAAGSRSYSLRWECAVRSGRTDPPRGAPPGASCWRHGRYAV